eukprot:m.1515580 g.1515580  ORF g.1515580 m.1515580 type:complete len:189 (+) comp25217_c0_seq22:732-1298(+)
MCTRESSRSCAGEGAALGEGLRYNNTLRVVRLARCRINDEGAEALAMALVEENTSVQELDMSSNGFGSDAMQAFAWAIDGKNLVSLTLRSCDLRHDDVPVLLGALPANSTLRELDLRFNKIGDKGASHLADLLRENDGLTHIDLRNNKIGHEIGYTALALALTENTSVLALELGVGVRHNHVDLQRRC